MTCGPWRPIVLEEYSVKISDLCCRVSVDTIKNTASVKVSLETEGGCSGGPIKLTIFDPNGIATDEPTFLTLDGNRTETTVVIREAQFWWPIGYGRQNLYAVSADLMKDVSYLEGTFRTSYKSPSNQDIGC